MERQILITGASSGIGQACAKRLAKSGHRVWLLARREERLQRLCQEIEAETGKSAQFSVVDLSRREEIERFLSENDFSSLDGIVNNAGLALGAKPFYESAIEDFDHMLEVNVRAVIHLTRGLIADLRRRPSADIVNIGSVAGRWTYPGGTIYCASKYAIRALSEGLRHDLLGENIRVMNIEPGMVETEFSEVRLQDKKAAKAVYDGMTPLSGQDIAESVDWVLSRPRHVNIQELVIYPTAQSGVGNVHRNRENDENK